MPKTRDPYPPEFREQIVALARAGRSVEDLARDFEPCAATIHGWVKQADRDGGRRDDGVTSQERDELGRRRRENRQLRQERDILAKAAAWFARQRRFAGQLVACALWRFRFAPPPNLQGAHD